jgi:flagellar biosynthesis/type III secretory pathway chaperone
MRDNKNKNKNNSLTPGERALHIRSSIQGIQRIIGECFAKYEENGNLDSLRLAFDSHVQLIEILKQVKEQYSYGHDYDFGK